MYLYDQYQNPLYKFVNANVIRYLKMKDKKRLGEDANRLLGS